MFLLTVLSSIFAIGVNIVLNILILSKVNNVVPFTAPLISIILISLQFRREITLAVSVAASMVSYIITLAILAFYIDDLWTQPLFLQAMIYSEIIFCYSTIIGAIFSLENKPSNDILLNKA